MVLIETITGGFDLFCFGCSLHQFLHVGPITTIVWKLWHSVRESI